MRIIAKECGRILDPRRLLLIAMFTLLYYQIFMNVDDYPENYPNTPTASAVWSFQRALVEEIGPVLTLEDWHFLEEKQEELHGKADEAIASNMALQELGISDFDTYKKTLADSSHSDISEEERRRCLKIISVSQDNAEVQQYIRLLERIDNMDTPRKFGYLFEVPKNEAEVLTIKNYGTWATPLFLKAKTIFCQREYSLLPYQLTWLLWEDMRRMTILLVICSLILLVPYQIHERLCGVTPLYAATHTGRKIFGIQWKAEIFSCGLISALQLLAYLGIFAAKGLTVYWKCPAWPEEFNTFWLDISFGAYMALYMFMIWFFIMGNTVLAYMIGRCCSNYIAGIAVSIPLGCVVSYLGRRLFNSPFAFTENVVVPLWEPMALAAWLAAAGGLLIFLLKKDRIRDL